MFERKVEINKNHPEMHTSTYAISLKKICNKKPDERRKGGDKPDINRKYTHALSQKNTHMSTSKQ